MVPRSGLAQMLCQIGQYLSPRVGIFNRSDSFKGLLQYLLTHISRRRNVTKTQQTFISIARRWELSCEGKSLRYRPDFVHYQLGDHFRINSFANRMDARANQRTAHGYTKMGQSVLPSLGRGQNLISSRRPDISDVREVAAVGSLDFVPCVSPCSSAQ